jgi:hypothetical protein
MAKTRQPARRKETPAEQRLAELEACVERGLVQAAEGMAEAGAALKEIRDSALYKPATFESYARSRYGIERAHAYRLIEYAETLAVLSPSGDIPNEAQARELAPLRENPEEVRAVWEAAKKEGTPTARKVRAARRAVREEEELNEALRDGVKKAQDQTEHAESSYAKAHRRAVLLCAQLRSQVIEPMQATFVDTGNADEERREALLQVLDEIAKLAKDARKSLVQS